MFDSLRNLFSGKKSTPKATPPPSPPHFEAEEEEIPVPEVKPAELLATLQEGGETFILDVREGYEWKQSPVRAENGITVVYIPMNSVPDRLEELPRDREIAVICASGARSYGVAHYLLEQGFKATNIDGGIGAWIRSGGAYEQG